MTAPAISVETVEDIDLTPVCESTLHEEDRPAADFWLDEHGCSESLLCAECLARVAAEFTRWVAAHGHIDCDFCGVGFSIFGQLLTKVVPLR